MGLDTWLEQDIRQFLDDEAKMGEQPRPPRVEDAASVVSGHDWGREISGDLKRGDIHKAKQLFTQLREQYRLAPQDHATEREHLYQMLQDAYVLIANHILDSARTDAILQRMESSSGDIFNAKIKPVDLTIDPTTQRAVLIPDFIPFTKDALARTDIFKKLEDPTVHVDPRHPLSFDPEALLRANKELSERATVAQQAAGVLDATVRDLVTALTLAIKDPRGALAAIDQMLAKDLPVDVRAAAQELRGAIVDREEMIAFTKQASAELARLGELAAARDELTAPTAERLRTQFVAFAQAHPHYPARHREHILRRIDTILASVAQPSAAATPPGVAPVPAR